MKSKRAVLILEGPWNLDSNDANRSSVLPFLRAWQKSFTTLKYSTLDIMTTTASSLH